MIVGLVRGCLTLRLELPEPTPSSCHVLDILHLCCPLYVIIGALEMVEGVHVSGKVGGDTPETFAAIEADCIVPTDGGDVFVQSGHRLKLELEGPRWGAGGLLERVVLDR